METLTPIQEPKRKIHKLYWVAFSVISFAFLLSFTPYFLSFLKIQVVEYDRSFSMIQVKMLQNAVKKNSPIYYFDDFGALRKYLHVRSVYVGNVALQRIWPNRIRIVSLGGTEMIPKNLISFGAKELMQNPDGFLNYTTAFGEEESAIKLNQLSDLMKKYQFNIKRFDVGRDGIILVTLKGNSASKKTKSLVMNYQGFEHELQRLGITLYFLKQNSLLIKAKKWDTRYQKGVAVYFAS